MNCATLLPPQLGGRGQVGTEHQSRLHPLPAASAHDLRAAELAGIQTLLILPSGVLYDDTVWWRWLAQLLCRMGLHTHAGAFRALWLREYYAQVCRGEQSYWDALRTFLLAAGLSDGQFDEVWAAGRPRWRTYQDGLRPFPHVPAALAALRAAGCTMDVFAHSPETGDQLAERYEQMGIGQFIDRMVSTRDIAESKLDAIDASAALEHLELATESTAVVHHIGCSAPPFGDSMSEREVVSIAVASDAYTSADVHVAGLDELACLYAGQGDLPLVPAA